MGAPWLSSSLTPSTVIANKSYTWSQSIIWGARRVKGAKLMSEQRPAFALNIVWGEGLGTEDDNIVWGNNFGDDDNIVWGNSFDLDDNIVWGNNIIWDNDDDNIVWGNSTELGSAFRWSGARSLLRLRRDCPRGIRHRGWTVPGASVGSDVRNG